MHATAASIIDSHDRTGNYGTLQAPLKEDALNVDLTPMNTLSIAAILSSAFTYGCIMSTLFLLILPIECQRIEEESNEYYSYTIRKSIALGGFAAIAGLTQLISPLVGLLSDNYAPRGTMRNYGKRLPYLILGSALTLIGLSGQLYSSAPIHKLAVVPPSDLGAQHTVLLATKTEVLGGAWIQYTVFYTMLSIGLNIAYTVMLAMIPDYISHSQTGVANGTLALMIVLGSLFGFGLFHVLGQNLFSMYKMYMIVSVSSTVATYIHVFDREKGLSRCNCSWEGDGEVKEEIEQGKSIVDEKYTTTTSTDLQVQDNGEKVDMFNDVVYSLLYEPLMHKSKKEILSAFWIDISQHRDFFIVTMSRFFYYMGISSQTFFLYFIHDMLERTKGTSNPEATVALLAVLGQMAGAITCYPVGIVSDQYFQSRRKPFVYMACILLGLGNMSLLLCSELKQMILATSILGAANGIYLAMDTSLAIDTLDDEPENDHEKDGHIHSNQHQFAQLLGVWGVFGFIGSALGPLVGGLVLVFVGRRSATDDQFYGFKGYECLFSMSAFYFLCSASCLFFVQKKSV
mmetsp:Transcript_11148/g.20867  ORF Transcript_11148/g.20867 Transcript_11148/m.20867 type:complete len:571 (+) Transcript_11148:78-1790(+)